MSNSGNPLGDRGKSQEEAWAHKQQQEAIEKMKRGAGAGDGKSDAAKADPAKSPAKKARKGK